MQEKSNFFTLQNEKTCNFFQDQGQPEKQGRPDSSKQGPGPAAALALATAGPEDQRPGHTWPPWPPFLQKSNKYATFASMEINENIKLLCRARGISFADLADRLNITRQTLYKQSTGAAQLASIERIAAALALPAWIILHPAPLAALAAWNQDQRQGRTDSAAAVIFCPHCKRPIQIHTAPDLADEKRTAEDGPSSKAGGDPDTWPEEDSNQDQHNSTTAEE